MIFLLLFWTALYSADVIETETVSIETNETDRNYFLAYYMIRGAMVGDLTHVIIALDNGIGPNIEYREDYTITPLEAAVKFKHPHVVQYLLSHGADKNHIPSNGYTALANAVSCKDRECRIKLVKILLDAKADHQIELGGETVFRIAVDDNALDSVQMFLAYKVPLYGGRITQNLLQHWPWSDDPKDWSTIYQLYLLDPEKALYSGLFKPFPEYIEHAEKVRVLFALVKEGSQIPGNMAQVSQLKLYIPLGLIDSNGDTLYDIAVKNHDKKMIITLLAQNEDCRDGMFKENWQRETPFDRVLKNSQGSLDMIIVLANLSSKP